MQGIFITGTNTEVGKTIIGRAIIIALVNRGIDVKALKPVESGVKDIPQDAMALLKASKKQRDIKETCLYALKTPASPHVAAKQEGIEIKEKSIIEFINKTTKESQMLIVEGAGGILVPLSPKLLYIDIIKNIGFPIVIVAPNVLGTINATLLTIEAAKKRNINILGVVLNGTDKEELGNAKAIEDFGKVPIIGVFPTIDENMNDSKLGKVAEKSLDIDCLLRENLQ